ncbi:TnsD family Tn7-like transposition protein [Shewanella indica]|uniref:TnsD family Tn7-like transposition protein n=1 Tax=Shewanella indica TaxID=768528 RepID=UPI003004F1E5
MRLPPPFPDELLLGRLIRHVTVSGEMAGTLVQELFGSCRASIHPFLTAGLARLAELTQEDAEALLNRQTLAPLFFFYLANHAQRLRLLLLANEGAKALRESQLPSFRVGHSVYLKWCPQCAQDDLRELGVTYWHRSHQTPGVTACFKHPVLLQRVELTSRQRLVAGLLPDCGSIWQSANSIETRVAAFSHGLLARLTEANTAVELASRYRQRLNELGFITAGGHVRRQSLLQRFSNDLELYRSSPDSPLLRSCDDYRYLSELLESGGSHHPFRHLLFGTWLFNTPEEFLDYKSPSAKPVSIEKNAEDQCALEQRCLTLLKEKRSMAEVSRMTGKSRCYLKRLAIQHGVPLNLRPKQLTPKFQQRILHLARAGMHREKIAEYCEIGVGSVEQVISSEPGLVEWRKKCHKESKRRRCRLTIVRYQQRNPDAMRRDVKVECNAAYFWLYQHDQDWFESELPQASKPIGFGQYKV